MYTSTASAILFTSLLSTASAFVPMQIDPLPTDLDTKVWIPLTTLAPQPTPTASPLSQITATPTPEEVVNILPVLDLNMVPDLKKRQGVGEAVAATAITQVSPITTYQIQLYRSGTQTQLNVVYTQTFDPIPDQWPSPTEAGTIGLGTIQGTIGVVKSKRSLPTQAPMVPAAEMSPAQKASNDDSVPLLDKLRKAGQEIKDELEALISKVKKLPVEEDDTSVPLEKEVKLHTTNPENADAFSFGESTTNNDPFSFGGPAEEESEESEEELTKLLPEIRTRENDARVLKAGTLAVIAVAIGTMCVSYL